MPQLFRREWEAEVLRLVRRYRLPEPTVGLPVVIDGQRRLLDVAWSEQMVDLEFDGFRVHMVRKVFDDDRVRQNALVAAGWTVFRLTSKLLQEDPNAAFAPIVAALGRRGHDIRHQRRVS